MQSCLYHGTYYPVTSETEEKNTKPQLRFKLGTSQILLLLHKHLMGLFLLQRLQPM